MPHIPSAPLTPPPEYFEEQKRLKEQEWAKDILVAMVRNEKLAISQGYVSNLTGLAKQMAKELLK